MATFRTRRRDAGAERARWLAQRFGQELRLARVAAGLTQRQLAVLAGVSQQRVSRAERGSRAISLDARCRMAAAAGHDLSLRLYPAESVRLRDSGQLALAQNIVDAAHDHWRAALEVPVAVGDPRAADLVLSRPDGAIHVEIERLVVDVQAQLRAGQLKRESLAVRLQRPVRLVLAVADTRANRARLEPFADLFGRTLPLNSREVWAAIRAGVPLSADGILFVRAAQVRRGTKSATPRAGEGPSSPGPPRDGQSGRG